MTIYDADIACSMTSDWLYIGPRWTNSNFGYFSNDCTSEFPGSCQRQARFNYLKQLVSILFCLCGFFSNVCIMCIFVINNEINNKESGFWCLTQLSTIFQLYRLCKFYLWRKPEFPEKTIDLSNVTGNLWHIMLYRVHLAWAGFELTMLVVMGTDCMGSTKSIYHTITTTTAPDQQ